MSHSRVRRALFKAVDHSELQKELKSENNHALEESKRRWNFDFNRGYPLQGNVKWLAVGPDNKAVPEFYRGRPPRKRRTRHAQLSPEFVRIGTVCVDAEKDHTAHGKMISMTSTYRGSKTNPSAATGIHMNTKADMGCCELAVVGGIHHRSAIPAGVTDNETSDVVITEKVFCIETRSVACLKTDKLPGDCVVNTDGAAFVIRTDRTETDAFHRDGMMESAIATNTTGISRTGTSRGVIRCAGTMGGDVRAHKTDCFRSRLTVEVINTDRSPANTQSGRDGHVFRSTSPADRSSPFGSEFKKSIQSAGDRMSTLSDKTVLKKHPYCDTTAVTSGSPMDPFDSGRAK